MLRATTSFLRLAALALQNRLQDLLIASQITTSECINRLQRQSQGLGIELIAAQLTVFQHHQLVGSRQAGLIQTAVAMDHHSALEAQQLQGTRHRLQ